MATWTALVNDNPHGSYDVEVQANTASDAKIKIQQIYDVGPGQIINLREENGLSFSFSGGDQIGGWIIVAAIVFVIWLFMEYFWIMMPLTVIALIAWIYNTFFDK